MPAAEGGARGISVEPPLDEKLSEELAAVCALGSLSAK